MELDCTREKVTFVAGAAGAAGAAGGPRKAAWSCRPCACSDATARRTRLGVSAFGCASAGAGAPDTADARREDGAAAADARREEETAAADARRDEGTAAEPRRLDTMSKSTLSGFTPVKPPSPETGAADAEARRACGGKAVSGAEARRWPPGAAGPPTAEARRKGADIALATTTDARRMT